MIFYLFMLKSLCINLDSFMTAVKVWNIQGVKQFKGGVKRYGPIVWGRCNSSSFNSWLPVGTNDFL